MDRYEKGAEGETTMILRFAVLFAYLFTVVQHESWGILTPVPLSVVICVLGSSPNGPCKPTDFLHVVS